MSYKDVVEQSIGKKLPGTNVVIEAITKLSSLKEKIKVLSRCPQCKEAFTTHAIRLLQDKPIQKCGKCRYETFKEIAAQNSSHPMETNGAWKGGRKLDKKGYVSVPDGKGRRLMEHRVVMEKVLGRKLLGNEEVHHKNGLRHDNRPENLELWIRGHQPKGARLNDVFYDWLQLTRNLFPEAEQAFRKLYPERFINYPE